MDWIGLDIGGANLKLADPSRKKTKIQPFELWRHPDELAENLASLAEGVSNTKIAVTMTGELCDCFRSKESGVRHIVLSTRKAFPNSQIVFWTNRRTWADENMSLESPGQLAASNWLATAVLASNKLANGIVCLIDMGSTTTDIVLIEHGKLLNRGFDDTSRLILRELVYTGFRRTPLACLLGKEVCSELFATIHDARIWLRMAPESPVQMGVDGKEMTRELSRTRLARMMGADDSSISDGALSLLAHNAVNTQRQWIADGISSVLGKNSGWPETWVVAGEGSECLKEWLSEWHMPGSIMNFDELAYEESCRDAAAVSVAILANQAFSA
jgi:probable H4MPT-linked C1 transfer pathway protein